MSAGSPSSSSQSVSTRQQLLDQVRRLTGGALNGLFAPQGRKDSSPTTIAGEKRKAVVPPDDPADQPSSSASLEETSTPVWTQVRHCAQPHVHGHSITNTDTLPHAQENSVPLGHGALRFSYASVDMHGNLMADGSGSWTAVQALHSLSLRGSDASLFGVLIQLADGSNLVLKQSSARQHLMSSFSSEESNVHSLYLVDEDETVEHLRFREASLREAGADALKRSDLQRQAQLPGPEGDEARSLIELADALPTAEVAILSFDTHAHLMSTFAALESVKMRVFGVTELPRARAAHTRGYAYGDERVSNARAVGYWSPFEVATASSVLSLLGVST